MKFRVIEQPAVEPISLEEARDHLRITPYGSPQVHPDDDYIEGLITAARQFCENYTGRALASQKIAGVVDILAGSIVLPRSPARSIDSITYVDMNGSTQTVSASVYRLDNFWDYYPSTVNLAYDQQWPQTRAQDNAATITYTAGYTTGESPDDFPLPSPIRAAMLLIVGNLYENRQQDVMGGTRLNFNSLPLGVYALLQPYRLGMGV
jgi:uncharacterized phiE125 gp8 family phage protein